MRAAQATKYVIGIAPLLLDNASGTAVAVDCKGYAFAKVIVTLGVTDIALTALKVTECDTSGGSYTDVVGTVFGTATDIAGAATTLPSATDDSKNWLIELDLRKRKRFLKVVLTAGDGSVGANQSVLVELSEGTITPVSAADRGCAQILRV